MPKKLSNKGEPNVHDELDGFSMKVNEFGELISNFHIDKLNTFLDKNVEDKKLKDKNSSEEE
jgi:hypothetical protein